MEDANEANKVWYVTTKPTKFCGGDNEATQVMREVEANEIVRGVWKCKGSQQSCEIVEKGKGSQQSHVGVWKMPREQTKSCGK